MKLIVGLGNPGTKYDQTRHNVGFEVIDYCARLLGITLSESKWKGQYGFTTINGEKVFLVKPLTYMNLSGECIRPLMDFYKIDDSELLVAYDDLDLPVGKIRLRQKGGHGGHNGIKSLIAHVGTTDFKRIRIGIDRPQQGENVANYVLGTFRPDEKEDIHMAIEQAAKACESWISEDFIQVMNKYN
ncbi:aminoacyl-tRNA hydrolase [Bacillus alkalicellulosilyticus]|uniref:aminoacyl-tRNA hydrolase n=1 Tax=Alkalihalobacterium alkalicellulosilyticum TaxID=1912214 RepID=UPI000998B7B2|nr:aminoacyl-tRNA hydrolase [Bacillus alkalicellulosilyticus]